MSFFYYDKTYSYEGYGVKFEYPESWEKHNTESEAIKKSIYTKKSGKLVVIHFIIVPINKNIFSDELKEAIENSGRTVKKTQHTLINNKKGFVIYSENKDRYTYSYLNTYIIHNGLAYNFELYTEDKIENVSEEYLELLDSVEFFKPEEKNIKLLFSEEFKPERINLKELNNSINPDKLTSNEDLLFKYVELYEKGLLTKEEFDNKKKKLLKNTEELIEEEKVKETKKKKGTFKKDFILIPIIIILIIAIIVVSMVGQDHSTANTEIFGLENNIVHHVGTYYGDENYQYQISFRIKHMPVHPEDYNCFCEFYDLNNKLIKNVSVDLSNSINPEDIGFSASFEFPNLMNLSHVSIEIIGKNGEFITSKDYQWNNNPNLIIEPPTS